MFNKPDTAVVEEVKAQLGELGEAVKQLGPINDLWRQAKNIFQQSSPNVRTTLEKSREIREKIFKLLDQPRCDYDDKAMAFANQLKTVPAKQRASLRKLIGEHERSSLSPYVSRADWLALEEKSSLRVLSGLIIQALILPDHEDERDVMVALAAAHVVCEQLGFKTVELFDEAATFAGEGVSAVFKQFGKRKDVTLEGFGLQRIDTAGGPRIRQII
jgi:hypothetical protein